jgi:hypothetical protein
LKVLLHATLQRIGVRGVSVLFIGHPELNRLQPYLGDGVSFFTVFTRITRFWVWHLVADCGDLWNESSEECLSFQILTMKVPENKGVRQRLGLKSLPLRQHLRTAAFQNPQQLRQYQAASLSIVC